MRLNPDQGVQVHTTRDSSRGWWVGLWILICTFNFVRTLTADNSVVVILSAIAAFFSAVVVVMETKKMMRELRDELIDSNRLIADLDHTYGLAPFAVRSKSRTWRLSDLSEGVAHDGKFPVITASGYNPPINESDTVWVVRDGDRLGLFYKDDEGELLALPEREKTSA